MNLYVMRHGETDLNKKNVYNCRIDEDLNSDGINEAKLAISKIKEMNIDIIISSPLIRALHTAQIVNINNLPIRIDDRLIERDGGALTGTAVEVESFYNEFFNYNYVSSVPGLERLDHMFKRVASLIDSLKVDYPDKNILLVTHGGIGLAVYYYFNEIPRDGILLHHHHLDNCAIEEYKI